jgi:UDP-N-acetyl-2-amino-2-deoxyglucuronate dehydrogenase
MSSKRKKLRVGVVGLGRIAPRHIEDSIKKIDELELVAVCDIKEQIAREIGRKEGVKWYKDYKDLIHDKRVDVVAVCTPNGLHFPIGREIAKAGKHCIMEKPISQNSSDAQKLVDLFKKSKGRMFPVLQVRYNPAVRTLKEFVENGALGKIYTASVIVRWARPQEYFSESDWKGTLKMDGGTLLTQAIHYIDVTQYILGKAKTVYGKMATVAHDIEVEDIANAIIDFHCGARVNLEFTVCTYPHNLECSLAVLGEKGTIKIGGQAMNVCELWEVQNVPKPIIADGISPNQYAGGLYVGSCPNHSSVYQNLVDVLVYGKDSFIQAEDAVESLRIIDGIKKSSTLRQEVIL